jgi:ureidoglycolate dehydrogenase (NAD+)
MTKPTAAVIVRYQDLARFVADIFVARGMAKDDAAVVAETLVWADLRGGESHGVTRVPRYLELMGLGQMDPKGRPHLVRDGGATVMIDGERCAGPVAMMLALAEAAKRAKEHGVCLALVRETTHAGAIGRYAEWAAERGFIAIIAAAGQPLMAYHGARVRGVSTSPLAIAVPGADGPVVFDMATSVAALGRINQARQAGEPIPEGWALSEDGRPTTDSKQATIPLPVGGAKGSGLALMFEFLASVLAGVPVLAPAVGPKRQWRHVQNVMAIVADVEAFRGAAGFGADVEELGNIIRALPRQKGFDEILLPGDRSRRTEKLRRQEGIPISRQTWDALARIAMAEGIAIPPISGDRGD